MSFLSLTTSVSDATWLMAFGMPEKAKSSGRALQKCGNLGQLDTVVFGMPKIWY
jgi:hypothetical protein